MSIARGRKKFDECPYPVAVSGCDRTPRCSLACVLGVVLPAVKVVAASQRWVQVSGQGLVILSR